MAGFVEGQDRQQVTLLPESLEDFTAHDNAVRIVDAFVDELDLAGLGSRVRRPLAWVGRHSTQACFSRPSSTATACDALPVRP